MSMLVDDPSAPSAFGGIYDVPEAARYLKVGSQWARAYSLPSQKLIRWIRRELASPGLTEVHGMKLLLGFEDLVSMRVIAALRASGVSWREIREMEHLLREIRGVPWPFATEFLWTGQGELFAEWTKHLVSGSRHGQAALDMLREYVMPVNGLVFGDESRLAISWEPFAGVVLGTASAVWSAVCQRHADTHPNNLRHDRGWGFTRMGGGGLQNLDKRSASGI